MRTESRIKSILLAEPLDSSITEISTFEPSFIKLNENYKFQIPTNLRLGHLAEKILSDAIETSSNYHLLHQGIQLIDDNNNTIGELDFIIKDQESNQILHVEFAYKFYLFDPELHSTPIHNWIGPNRNDSLSQKLEKLKQKQFPLLFHDLLKSTITETQEISQRLCVLASLFIPYNYQGKIPSSYKKHVKGYYWYFKEFTSLDHSEKLYYIPLKKEWGIDPTENYTWLTYNQLKDDLTQRLHEKRAPLVWQKQGEVYSEFFIVWW